jgi:hypothetical protein
MKLLDVIKNINKFSEEDTIYAVEPWSALSETIVLHDENGKLPKEAREKGMTYFLEIFIAKEFLEDLQSVTKQNMSIEESCNRIIEYALKDA